MITSTELTNEHGNKIKIEVETAVASDDVQIRFITGSGSTHFTVTRKEASALHTCLNDL